MLQCVVLFWVVGLATTQQSFNTNDCENKCSNFYSLQSSHSEQINDSWSACVHGCEFYSRLDDIGDEPINTLQNCNYSCDERYSGEGIQACQAGCGFNFDKDTQEFTVPSPRIKTEIPNSRPGFISLSLPKLFEQINNAMPRLNSMIEKTFSNTFDNEFSMPRLPSGIFGRKDDEGTVDPLFDNFFSSINNQMSNMMSVMPDMPRISGLNSWSPFSFPEGGPAGKITVIKAGPGYMEEKHYDIGTDGNLVEITEQPPALLNDGLAHENPMDSSFDEDDVEIFKPLDNSQNSLESLESQNSLEPISSLEESLDSLSAPVPQVKEDPEEESVNPFLSVIRNSIEEGEKLKEEFINKYRSFKDSEYTDTSTCNSENLRWSDWVACVHIRLGAPRWLTAATIALGIIFSVWLCLVIPTAAPKRRFRNLIIRKEKLSPPSAVVSKELTAAEAKEAEANASKDLTVSVITVDMPPCYNEVTPGSPAPSYKSEMGRPSSPAPSYKSVDLPPVLGAEKKIEPVHGKESSA